MRAGGVGRCNRTEDVQVAVRADDMQGPQRTGHRVVNRHSQADELAAVNAAGDPAASWVAMDIDPPATPSGTRSGYTTHADHVCPAAHCRSVGLTTVTNGSMEDPLSRDSAVSIKLTDTSRWVSPRTDVGLSAGGPQ